MENLKFYTKTEFDVGESQHIFNMSKDEIVEINDVINLERDSNYLIVCDNETGKVVN